MRFAVRTTASVTLLILLAACSKTQTAGVGNLGATPTATSASPAKTSPPPTSPPSIPETTSATTPAPLVLHTPEAAAKHLYNAWKAASRTAARQGATSSAVNTLFANHWSADTYFFGGCSGATAPTECDYNWASGVIKMQITGDPTAGFKVSAVTLGSAG